MRVKPPGSADRQPVNPNRGYAEADRHRLAILAAIANPDAREF